MGSFISSYGFDWKSQSNESLRSDMLNFVKEFSKTTQDKKLSKALERFVSSQMSEKDPYTWIAATNAFVDKWLERYPAEMAK